MGGRGGEEGQEGAAKGEQRGMGGERSQHKRKNWGEEEGRGGGGGNPPISPSSPHGLRDYHHHPASARTRATHKLYPVPGPLGSDCLGCVSAPLENQRHIAASRPRRSVYDTNRPSLDAPPPPLPSPSPSSSSLPSPSGSSSLPNATKPSDRAVSQRRQSVEFVFALNQQTDGTRFTKERNFRWPFLRGEIEG